MDKEELLKKLNEKITEMNNEELSSFRKEINSKNLHKFRTFLRTHTPTYGIDSRKAGFKIDKYIEEFCQKNNFEVAGHYIYFQLQKPNQEYIALNTKISDTILDRISIYINRQFQNFSENDIALLKERIRDRLK